MWKRALLFASVSFLVACGSNVTALTGGTAGSETTTTTGTGTGGTGTVTAETFTVSWGPIMVAAGVEDTQCVVKKLNNPAAFHAGSIHNLLDVGSHHMIVYETSDTVEQPTPFACQPFTDLAHPEKGTPLMVSQKKDDLLTLPAGVGIAVGAEQFVRLELHYINTTTGPLNISASSTFVQMPESEVQNEAGFLFMGDIDINLAPHSTATVGPIYMPEPAPVVGSHYFGITGHEHQWGTDVTVASTTGATGTDTSLYNVPNWLWSEPTTVYLNPAIQVPTGGGFRYTCTWNNESASTVTFGESATQEMCFFWTYYYPNKGAHVCFHTDQIMGGFDLCCPDNATLCSKFLP